MSCVCIWQALEGDNFSPKRDYFQSCSYFEPHLYFDSHNIAKSSRVKMTHSNIFKSLKMFHPIHLSLLFHTSWQSTHQKMKWTNLKPKLPTVTHTNRAISSWLDSISWRSQKRQSWKLWLGIALLKCAMSLHPMIRSLSPFALFHPWVYGIPQASNLY